MNPITYTARWTLAVTLLPACAVSLWLVSGPDAMASSTYSMLAALFIALGGLTLMTYRNAQAVGSTAQLLHATKSARPPVAVAELERALDRRENGIVH